MKSLEPILRFGEFTLDPANRLLARNGAPVELGGRYLDTLVLLATERGQLISKDRLHEEVWRGVPVTDEAFSQAIMALRRALGDDAGKPRFIETVPRHGYRFIAALNEEAVAVEPTRTGGPGTNYRTLQLVGGGALGAAAAGSVVGLAYGSFAASDGAGSALSLVLVLICISILAALISGLGIAGGIGLLGGARKPDWWRPVIGGALGGLALGGFARLLGLDAMRLLIGTSPASITGASEGLAMGIAVGTGLLLVRRVRPRFGFAAAAAIGAIAGLATIALGGTLMAGSLMALVDRFPAAALSQSLAPRGGWMLLSGAFEGGVFAVGIVAGMQGLRRR